MKRVLSSVPSRRRQEYASKERRSSRRSSTRLLTCSLRLTGSLLPKHRHPAEMPAAGCKVINKVAELPTFPAPEFFPVQTHDESEARFSLFPSLFSSAHSCSTLLIPPLFISTRVAVFHSPAVRDMRGCRQDEVWPKSKQLRTIGFADAAPRALQCTFGRLWNV